MPEACSEGGKLTIVEALGWYFPDSLGGTEVYVAALARRFAAAGHHVLIAAPQPGLDAPRQYQHDGVPVFRYPVPRRATRAEAQEQQVARGADMFHRWLRETRPDVVHAQTFVTGLGRFEIEAARDAGAAVVATTHSSALGYLCHRGTLMYRGTAICDGRQSAAKCVPCTLENRGLPFPAGRVIAALPAAVSRTLGAIPGRLGTLAGMVDLIERNVASQHRLFDLVDRFVVLTDAARQIVVANGAPASKVLVNRLGHDLAVVSEPSSVRMAADRSSPLRIGYLGRLDSIKGVLDLARAVASLSPEVNVRVEFCAPLADEHASRTKSSIERIAGGDPRVVFSPGVPHARVAQRIQEYDVLCCPAVCLEGGPTVALESRALGVPVIGTWIGGLAEIVRDGVDGALVPPGDWQALAQTIQAIARDRGVIERWRKALTPARTMDDVASDYLQVFAQLCGRRACPPKLASGSCASEGGTG